jgi:chemosensory pili system protein ChpA (sensor histidine kinase/response regulator)
VRLVAREQGKLVDLVLEGDAIELDKTVLEEMEDPLVHLLRNAVDHGIELPAARKRAGKPEHGEIRLRAFQEGNRVVIQVGDDGAGMDIGALRAAAVRGGFVPEGEGDRWSAEELQSLTFLPGFTTAAEVSHVSGRGVGLDIVRTNIRKLKGSIGLESTPGKGTLFTIRLPMTLAVMRALMVKACNQTFAVPHGAVTAILRVDPDEINHVGSAAVVQLDDQAYPLIRLAEALSLKRLEELEESRFPVLILDVGAHKVALGVDQLLGEREVVVKSLGSHLRRVEGIAGATLMGDGSVVLILNPVELVGEKSGKRPEIARSQPRPASGGESLTVMVVDDSITVRRVVSNLIRSAGWTPVAARDGLEALEIIQRSPDLPDAVLVDIEMPRMDGYELMSTLRAHPSFAGIPLLVLTSRTGEKHRQKALSVGAAGYIVKPYQDALLLEAIRDSARSSRERATA